MLIPDPDFIYPAYKIPDLATATKVEGERKFDIVPLVSLCSTCQREKV
jgi:hypothetical protein